MKKLSYFVALAVLLMSVSCQKEDTPLESSVKEPVFTATIANDDTKTSLDLTSRIVSWTLQDEITITDNNSTSVKYVVNSIDVQGKAALIKKSGESGTLGDGPYTATYGEAPSTSQTYTETEGVQNVTNLPMSASSETPSLTFTVSCGLLKVTLTESGQSITSVAVSDGTTTYTLNSNSAVSIASGATFYIAVPAGTYTNFEFTNSNGAVSKRKGLSIKVEANHIKPVSSSYFTPTYTEGDYSGPGIYAAGTWWAPVNCGYDETDYQYGMLYQWGRKYGQGYNDNSYTDGDYPGKSGGSQSFEGLVFSALTKYPDGDTYNGKFYMGQNNWYDGDDCNALWGATKTSYDPCPTGWRVPTKAELEALCGSATGARTVVDGTHGNSECKGLYYNGTTAANPSSGIFLPAAGHRMYQNYDTAKERGSYGYYWSETTDETANTHGWMLRFINSDCTLIGREYKSYGFSVRCVLE